VESLLLERVPVLLFVVSAFRLNLSDQISGSNRGEFNVMKFGNTVQLNNLENTFYCLYQQMHNIYIGEPPHPRIQLSAVYRGPKKKLEN